MSAGFHSPIGSSTQPAVPPISNSSRNSCCQSSDVGDHGSPPSPVICQSDQVYSSPSSSHSSQQCSYIHVPVLGNTSSAETSTVLAGRRLSREYCHSDPPTRRTETTELKPLTHHTPGQRGHSPSGYIPYLLVTRVKFCSTSSLKRTLHANSSCQNTQYLITSPQRTQYNSTTSPTPKASINPCFAGASGLRDSQVCDNNLTEQQSTPPLCRRQSNITRKDSADHKYTELRAVMILALSCPNNETVGHMLIKLASKTKPNAPSVPCKGMKHSHKNAQQPQYIPTTSPQSSITLLAPRKNNHCISSNSPSKPRYILKTSPQKPPESTQLPPTILPSTAASSLRSQLLSSPASLPAPV
ncbi:uncharacterized protein LOC135104550 [Scylla paramamosain]|uniref:uncharacterized protein LOC135104550 n=1 Tax=Scylla paramamosain TaxID=85552 RepID=UPI0030832039